MVEMSYTNRMYALADALGMALDGDGETGKITGARIKKWRLREVNETFEFSQKVVSSGIVGDRIAVIAKVAGNLAVMAMVDLEGRVEVHVLNLAKLATIHKWIEENKPKTKAEMMKRLGNSVVASFNKIGKTQWQPIAAAV